MPIKRKSRRKTGKRKSSRSSRTKKLNSSGLGKGKFKYGNQAQDVVTYMSRLPNPCPLPNRFVTSFSCQNQGYYPAATGTGAYWQVALNSPVLPFSAASTVSGTTLPNPYTAISTLQPIAWSSMFNNRVYNSYRVYASKIRVKVIPTSLTDPIAFGIYPAIPGSALNYAISDNMPHGKNWLITTEKGVTVCENFVTLPVLNGISQQAMRDDVSTTYTGSTGVPYPLRPFNWYCNFYDLTQANIGSKLCFDVNVIYYVELFDLNYDYLTQA